MPIKFILQSRRLNFLKYILDQEEGSLLKDIFIEQKNEPKQGDWVSIVKKDLKKLDIKLSFNEIKNMSKSSFKKLVTEKCESAAFHNLKQQVKEKGKEIEYRNLEMQHYLTKYSHRNVEEKKISFSLRARMTKIKTNLKLWT